MLPPIPAPVLEARLFSRAANSASARSAGPKFVLIVMFRGILLIATVTSSNDLAYFKASARL